MSIDFIKIILGLLIIFILSILTYKLQYLDRGGVIAGIIIGSIILIGFGWPALILMMIFFIFSTFSTRLRYNYKRQLGLGQEKGGKRGWRNTLANGGIAASSALASLFLGGEIFFAFFLGAMATSMSDTLATEIGLLSRSRPRLITNLKKKVGAGTSGGISLLGEIMVVSGSLLIGILAFFLELSSIPFFTIILLTLLGGLTGSHIDSILGATIQSMNRCIICGIITESNNHHNKPTESFKGLKIIENNTVNFLSTVAGASTAAVVLIII
jgi:uncharacterized protein (TIGR00297 family)